MDSYPLSDTWNLYYDYNTKRNSTLHEWEQSLVRVCQLHTVPEFLYTIDHMEACSKWPIYSNIHLFREGIRPTWEDTANRRGGKWIIELQKGEHDIDPIWSKTMAFCLSEQAEGNVVCGCVFSPRRDIDRVAVWTSCADEQVKRIGEQWRAVLRLQNVKLEFKLHENAIKGVKDKSKNLYVL